jgi:hypothetical protein
MRIAETRRRSDCAAFIRSCQCAGVTPKRKRPCCCATGSLCWTVSGPTSTRSWAANGSDWLVIVSGDRVRLSRVRFTNDRWDNAIAVCDRLDAWLRRRRARQLRRLAARHAVSAVGRAARSIVGCVLGGVARSRLCIVALIVVRSFHQEARDETGLIDGERVPAGRFAD